MTTAIQTGKKKCPPVAPKVQAKPAPQRQKPKAEAPVTPTQAPPALTPITQPGFDPKFVVSAGKALKVFESRQLSESQLNKIKSIKEWASFLYAEIDTISVRPTNAAEPSRLIAVAKTSLEESVMWAIKAVSRFQS